MTDPTAQNGDTIVLHDIDGMETRKVQSNGNVHLGRDYAGCEVTLVYRVDKEETDVSDSEDTDS